VSLAKPTISNDTNGHGSSKATSDKYTLGETRELFDASRTSRSKIIGSTTVIALLISGTLTFLLLSGLTPITPNQNMALLAAALNGTLIAILLFLIGKEVVRIIRSRRRGRAASRLHVRIIGLFCLVAAVPAVLVAIVAGITLDLGLDRWFEIRTKRIVESSLSVARAYQNETTRVLMGNTLSMAANLDRNRQRYVLDRTSFQRLLTLEARGRGFIASALIDDNGEVLLSADLESQVQQNLPKPPDLAIELATEKGEPVPIPPGNTNLIGAVFKLREIPDAYLYSIIAVPPAVIEAVRETERNNADYTSLEGNRFPFQVAFALLYTGVCLIVLLSAIWMGISVANRIVTPIRRLMFAASEVGDGNLDAKVDVYQSEGDLRFLSETFNTMIGDLKSQRQDLLRASDLMDQRARFIEAVLAGVSAAVIGVDHNGCVTIANRTAMPLLGLAEEDINANQRLADLMPELQTAFSNAVKSGKPQYHEQISIVREGRERTLNVQVTVEREQDELPSYVLTLDDITDLVSAQRNSAWADVARRIAHEIKNPLTPIQLSAERIRRRYGKHITEDREVFDNCTDTIIRQVGDIGRMVDEFSAFARMPKPEMAQGDLRKVIRETVFLQKVGFPEIEFKTELPQEPLRTIHDERMVSQALINLIKNSAEAIESKMESIDFKGKIQIQMSEAGNKAMIEIIDNGKGLPEENRQRLLEPYMTTREKGTGLGLAIVRKIIEDHSGTLELIDAPQTKKGDGGAIVRIYLPLNTPKHEKTEGATHPTKSKENA